MELLHIFKVFLVNYALNYFLASSQIIPPELSQVISFDPQDIRFLSFAQAPFNASEYTEIKLGDKESLEKAGLVSGQPVHIITHGFFNNITEGPCSILAPAYLDTNTKNVICVDWSKLAGPKQSIVSGVIGLPLYFAIVRINVPTTGRLIANFTEFLIDNGIATLDSIELIGHSLGAHASGVGGRQIKRDLGQSVGRIVGLDPAGPFYQAIPPANKLSKSDAKYIEAIHTDSLFLGTLESEGTLDWWVNGGRGQDQYGCWGQSEFMGCSHRFSIEYYARAIRGESFFGCRCQKTTLVAPLNLCQKPFICNNRTMFGPFANPRGTGDHYVTIN